MIAAILRLFYGADELVLSFARLIAARKQATAQHAENADLRQKLAIGEADLSTMKGEYAAARTQLEAAYFLELN